MTKTTKLLHNYEFVIPANAGIQSYVAGFRVPLRGPGMTMQEIVMSSEGAP